jgi:transposase-like protein
MQMIVSTIARERSVAEACRELQIKPSYFDELRTRVLRAGVEELAPRPVGRPPRRAAVSESEVDALRQRVTELERENAILRAQVELAGITHVAEAPRPKSHGGATVPRRGSRPAATGGRGLS